MKVTTPPPADLFPEIPNALKRDITIARIDRATGLSVRAEFDKILLFCRELGMNKVSKDYGEYISLKRCDQVDGSYQNLINSFLDLACAGKPEQRDEMKAKIIDYFTGVTDQENPDRVDYSWHYSAFCNAGPFWQQARTAAYVCYPPFAKEVEAMCAYVKGGMTGSTIKNAASKAAYADKFLKIVTDVKTAMEQAGGISPEAITEAQKATATFFPALLENCPKPEAAREMLQAAAATTSHTGAIVARRETTQRQKVGMNIEREELAPLQEEFDKQTKEWVRLWQQYGKNTNKVKVSRDTPQEVRAGLNTLNKVLDAMENPALPLNIAPLKQFQTRLKTFEASIVFMLETPATAHKDADFEKLTEVGHYFGKIIELVDTTLEQSKQAQPAVAAAVIS